MNKLKISQKLRVTLPIDFSILYSIVKGYTNDNPCVLSYDRFNNDHLLTWERDETDEEYNNRVAKSERTKENIRNGMLDQIAAIEKRIKRDQAKLESVQKVVAERFS